MRKLPSITAIAAVAVMAFAIPSTASAADQARFGGTVVLVVPVAPAQGARPAVETAYTSWSGRITAKSSACAYKRLIRVWAVRPGDDRKLGSTRGKRFTINGTTTYSWYFKKMDYLAKAGRTYATMEATSKCKAAQSDKFGVRVNAPRGR